MGDLGSVNWREFEKFLLSRDCALKRIKGDHRIYWKYGMRRPVVLPQYDPLPPFIIMNNLRIVGATREEFISFLGR